MPAKLVLANDLTSILHHVNSEIEKSKEERLRASTYLLLPTSAAIRNVRWQLDNSLGIRLVQFYGLGEIILDEGQSPVYRLSTLNINRLVRRITADLQDQGKLTTFSKVWDKYGFIHVLIDWLREVKSQGISPEKVQEHAVHRGNERDRQLAIIYQQYQTHLHEYQASDGDGILWLAAEELEKDATLLQSDEPFFVLGFDHFNPLQMRILQQLAIRRGSFNIYLLWDAERRPDNLALYRLGRTRKMLEEGLSPQVILWEETRQIPDSLTHLRKDLFEIETKLISDPEDGAVRAIAAASRQGEVHHAVRSIKKHLIAGVQPHQVGLLTTDRQTYLPMVRAVAKEYGVPVQTEEKLVDQPAIINLINLLHLFPDFPWRQTMEVLRSPYFHQPWLSNQQVDLLEQVTRYRPVLSGRDQWQSSLQFLSGGDDLTDDDERYTPQWIRQITPEVLREIESGLLKFFDHLTPLPSASVREYGFWLQGAVLAPFPEDPMLDEEIDLQREEIASLQMWRSCQEVPEYASSDLQALAKLTEVVSQLITSTHLKSTGQEKVVSWEQFRDDLISLLPDVNLPIDSTGVGVTFEAIHAARSAIFDYTYVLGMSEGEFPRLPKADCLYSSVERQHHPLPLLQIHPAEDASLWWQLISNCRKSLTILRPYLDDNGAEWLPSPYWEEVVGRISNLKVVELPIADIPGVGEAACQAELLTALAIDGAHTVPAAIEPQWQAAVRAHKVIQIRQSWQPARVYEGYLESDEVLSDLRRRFSPAYHWSPSRLNRYGHCPFGFFAETILQLEARQDPVDGLDAMQQGSLLHAILEQLHAEAKRQGYLFSPQYKQVLIQSLEAICAEMFKNAPVRFGFRPSALWRHEQKEILRLLRTLVVWECDTNGDPPRYQPHMQEVAFGFGLGSLPAVIIETRNAGSYRIAGVIDRLDIDSQGNLRVIDYKSGSGWISKNDIETGLAFQTALYALAVEPRLTASGRVVESAYLLIPKRETSGVLKFEGKVGEDAFVQGIVTLAGEFIERILCGEFPSKPGKASWGSTACQRACDFASFCRVTRRSIVKVRLRRDS